ncbi:PRD domain-containing protein [Ornithinibacillus gellani]|uniref:BglG family transcription antiterminator LicT n=1 Tax=Ornithinibacillus gellani TaxID=2293253 RepID=UPI000F49D32E|nr:PRD domain-containing protein [Ornithinibacillus gellani]TQS75031.1 PRD domain-containing protein [Ornithinibacillus gellani]
MNIDKVINNNVVSVINDQDKELVIMGRGLGFQRKPGDMIDESKIEKIFTLDSKDVSDQFKTLLREVPIETMEIVEDIIQIAKTEYHKQLNDIIYVALTDHVNFAIERQKNNQSIKNGLLWEIKKLYKDEYAIGLKAIQMIAERLHVNLAEDEAGFIAMHIVNAELNENVSNMKQITGIIQDVLNIVKYHFRTDFDEDSLNFFRFITHLKFFAQRLMTHTDFKNHDEFLYELIKEKHPDSFECTKKIETYIKKEYGYQLSNEEKLYLTIHIERVMNR